MPDKRCLRCLWFWPDINDFSRPIRMCYNEHAARYHRVTSPDTVACDHYEARISITKYKFEPIGSNPIKGGQP